LESRTPLALAATFLSRLPQDAARRSEAVEKILKQLRKADLPLERLLRLAGQRVGRPQPVRPIDVGEAVAAILRELPESEGEKVELRGADAIGRVSMPRESLSFCVESMLSFALRTRPLDRRVRVDLDGAGGSASICVRGDWTPVLDAGEDSEIATRWKRKTIEDLALASDVIDEVAGLSGGRFLTQLEDGLALSLVLPMHSEKEA
jgi:hypothetical protein